LIFSEFSLPFLTAKMFAYKLAASPFASSIARAELIEMLAVRA
jgi:hypothetical protein